MKYFLCVIGMVLIIEGLPYFTFPDKMKALLLRIPEITDNTLRICGIASILTGLALVYFGTR